MNLKHSSLNMTVEEIIGYAENGVLVIGDEDISPLVLEIVSYYKDKLYDLYSEIESLEEELRYSNSFNEDE